MSSDIVAKRTYKVGDIELETSETAGSLLGLAAQGRKGPSGWDLSALAVAVSTSMEIDKLTQMLADVTELVETLGDRVSGLMDGLDPEQRVAVATSIADKSPDFAQVVANLRAVPDPVVEPTPEALADDYARRLAAVQVLAAAGAGWPEVIAFAFHPATRLDLQRRDREPTPTELRTIEKWLNQNAKKGPAL